MQREVILILGQTGSGKTTIAKQLIHEYNRLLLIDADFREFPIKYFETIDRSLDYFERENPPYFRVGFTPLSAEYPIIFDLAQALKNLMLVLEEADRFSYDDEYDEIVSRGRHYGISLMALSLYPYKLPPALRRQATRLITFYHHEPNDLDYIADIIGSGIEDVQTLQKFEYLDWKRETGTYQKFTTAILKKSS